MQVTPVERPSVSDRQEDPMVHGRWEATEWGGYVLSDMDPCAGPGRGNHPQAWDEYCYKRDPREQWSPQLGVQQEHGQKEPSADGSSASTGLGLPGLQNHEKQVFVLNATLSVVTCCGSLAMIELSTRRPG